MNFIYKAGLFFYVLFISVAVLADDIPLPKDEGGIPLIKEWVRKVKITKVEDEKLRKVQGRVLFIEKWTDNFPTLVNVDIKKFNEVSMFKTLGADEMHFALNINGFVPAKAETKAKDKGKDKKKNKKKGKEDKKESSDEDEEESSEEANEGSAEKTKKKDSKDASKVSSKPAFYDIAARVLDVVMIVEKDPKKDGHVKMIDARRKKVIYRGKAPDSYDPMVLYSWLSRLLGYHGVVVDSAGDYVLVAASSGILAGDINSLILKDSTEKTVIRPSDRQGLGLLKLERALGKYGLFSIVINEGEVPIGSKVIIEVNSAKKTQSAP